jgi:hypothetical protein
MTNPLTAIEVKSRRSCEFLPGIAAFVEVFKPKRTVLVGGDGIPSEEPLLQPVGRRVYPRLSHSGLFWPK